MHIRYEERNVYPEGASMFGQYAESLKGIALVIPNPEVPRKIEWPKNPFDCHEDLTPEHRQELYGPMNPRLETLEDEKMLPVHWPAYNYDGSMIAKIERETASAGANLPSILEVLDILCYDEEKSERRDKDCQKMLNNPPIARCKRN